MASWKKVIVSGSAAALSSLTLDTALPVAQGGIGASSLTDKAVLISQDSGTDAVGAVALTTNGQIIIGGADGPAAATITGTSNEVEITNGANSIQVGLPDDVTIGGGLTVTNDITLTNSATDVDLIDNNASALSFDASGKAGILEIVTTNDAEKVNMSGDLDVTGTISGSVISGSFVGDGSNLTGVAATSFDIDALSALGGASVAQGDNFILSDAGTEKKVTFSNLEDSIFANVSGDATVAAGGALTIAADSVEGTMLNTNAADTTTLELSSDTLSVLKVPNALTVDNATIQLDSGTTFDGSGAKTISIKDGGVDADALAAAVAGAGLTGGGGSALAVGAGTGVTVNANDIAIGQAVATDSNVTFANLTLSGDLTVNGTTTSVNSTNLLVEDKFILLNSGSATGDGGIIVQSGSTFSGSAFAWDDSADRWAVQFDTGLGSGQTAVAPEAYASLYVQNAYTGSSTYTVKGNIRVDDSDESIWIYS